MNGKALSVGFGLFAKLFLQEDGCEAFCAACFCFDLSWSSQEAVLSTPRVAASADIIAYRNAKNPIACPAKAMGRI